MRICLVSAHFYPASSYGGPVSATWGLSKKIVDNGVKIFVSTTNANGKRRLDVRNNKFIEKKENLFVKYYWEEIINRFSLAFIFGIWKDIRKADVVYIQYIFHYTVFFSLVFSLIQNKQIIICPRGSFSFFTLSNSFSFLKSVWLKLFIDPFYKHITWHASSYLEKYDIKRRFPDAKVIIINDGVDFQSFQDFKRYNKQELLNKYLDIDVEYISNIFFSMGRLHLIKRFDILIDTFLLYLEKDKHAKLIIAGGDDGVGKELHQQIVKLELENSVFLIGEIGFEDKKVLLNNSDYFTLASDFESFGVVVIEALSCGRPILLSSKTPWKDLKKNRCGILVNNDKNSFLQGFLQITNESYDKKVIQNYVRSNYDFSIIASQFLANLKSK